MLNYYIQKLEGDLEDYSLKKKDLLISLQIEIKAIQGVVESGNANTLKTYLELTKSFSLSLMPKYNQN